MNKIAMGISCWNRPHYFSKLITSLQSQILDLKDVDIHLFLDGDICKFTGASVTSRSLIDECEKIFDNSMLPNKTKLVRSQNFSIALHQFEMMQILFSKYEQVIFLEDDVVVSPNFVYLMKLVLKQYSDDKEIFSVSPGFKLLCKPNEVEKYKYNLKIAEGHFWAEAMWKHKWELILPKMRQYMKIVSTRPYRERENHKIRELFANGGRSMPTTSQDNAKDWAISTSGMKRARMVVNRATGVGDIGFHSTVEKLKKSGDGHNVIHVFSDDRNIERFDLL